jgi:hypothetical protein
MEDEAKEILEILRILQDEVVYFSYDRREIEIRPSGGYLTKHGWTL